MIFLILKIFTTKCNNIFDKNLLNFNKKIDFFIKISVNNKFIKIVFICTI